MSRPEPLPPQTRPVGQLVAETLRFYGDRFWRVLALGLPIAVLEQISHGHRLWVQVAVLAASIPALAATFVVACRLVRTGPFATAFVAGVLVLLPVPLLVLVYVLPAIVWLGFVGMCVPAAVYERLPLRAALRRGIRLARADLVHAVGSLATFAIVYFVARLALAVLLHGQADAAERTAIFLGDLVLSPILFVGGALLYFDQAARL